MRKIRVLALLLAIMMVLSVLIVACKDTEEDKCADGEHNWKKETTVQKRSCTDALIKQKECRDCGEIEQWEDAPPTGHRYDSSQKIYMEDATCTQDGHTVNHCYLGCGSYADKIEVLPGSALGHTYITYSPVADGTTEIAQCIRCTATNTRILAVVLDMSSDRSHLSFQTLKLYNVNGLNAPVDTDFVKIGDKNHLHVERPASGYVGSAEFGAVISPRVDILTGVDYVVEVGVKLDKEDTGALNLITGKKASFNQRIDFVKYVPGENGANGTLESVVGTFYELTDDDYTNGITVAAVLNDAELVYQIYVNNKLASEVIAYEGDYYAGLELGTINVTMSKEYGESSFDISGIYVYPGSEPKAYDGESVNIGYGVKEFATGEKVAYKLPVDSEGHVHDYTTVVKTVTANCYASGYTVKACSCGGESIVSVVGKTDHRYEYDGDIDATCTEPALRVVKCAYCGVKNGTHTSPKLGHALPDTGYSVLEATCTEDGYNHGKCERCGIDYIDESTRVPALGCAIGENFTVVAPTCTTDGYTHGPCVRCGNDYVDPNSYIGTYGHYSFNAPSSVQELTCEQDGKNTYTCLGCGIEYVDESETVEAEGHQLYSEIQTIEGKEYIVTKCTNCDYNKKKSFAKKDFPTYDEVTEEVGVANIIFQEAAKPGVAITDQNYIDKVKDGWAGTSWIGTKEAGSDNTYITVTSIPFNEAYTKFSNSNNRTHSYVAWGAKTNATKGTSVVFDVDVKFPDTLGTNEVNGEMLIQARGVNASNQTKTFELYMVKSDGSVQNGSREVIAPAGTVTKDEWTRISVAIKNITPGANTAFTVYVDGVIVYQGSGNTTEWAAAVINDFRTNFRMQTMVGNTENEKTHVICLDNATMYYGDKPVYNFEEINTFRDMSKIKFDDVTTVPEGSTFAAEAGITFVGGEGVDKDYITNFGYRVTYRPNAAVTLVERGTGDNKYHAINFRFEKDVTPTSTVNFAGVGSPSWDTHILVSDVPKSGTYTVSYDLTFNEITGCFTLHHGRKEPVSGSRADRNLLVFDNGKLIAGNSNTIGITDTGIRIEKGQRIKLDLVDKQETDKLYIYVDGVLRYVHDYSADTDYASRGEELKSYGIKIFNMSNKGIIDVDLNSFDIYDDRDIPIGYIGLPVEDQVIESNKENVIVSFNENSNLENVLGMDSKDLPARYFYETVTDGSTSYLALKMSTVKVAAGGVSIDYIGYKGFNVGSPTVDGDGNPIDGAWVLTTKDHKTNGRNDIVLSNFSGLPTRVESDVTLYDMSEYESIRFRYFVSSNLNNAKAIVLINNPRDGGLVYFSKWLDLTPGWHDDTFTFESLRGDKPTANTANVTDITFKFEAWGGTGDGNGNAVDGLGFHLAEIALVEADQVLTGTGYMPKMFGHDCKEEDLGSPVVVQSEATCTTAAYTYAECTVCGHKKVTITAPATGHNMVMKNKVDPTCETYGYELWECDNESCDYSYTVVLAKTLHNYIEKAHDDNLAAGCLNGGVQYYVCGNEKCELVEGENKLVIKETLEPLGHDYDAEGITVTTEGNACVGIITKATDCARCGCGEWIVENIPAEGHDYQDVQTVAPGCKDGGLIEHICTKCGGKEEGYSVPVDALGHQKPAEYLITPIIRTCKTDSGIIYTCLRCGEEQTEYDGYGVGDHEFGDWVQEAEATCVKAGYREKYCVGCNGKYSELRANDPQVQIECTYPVATGEHNYGEPAWNTEDEYQVRILSKKCSDCDNEIVLETIAAKYDDATEGLVFEYVNGKYTLVGFEAGAQIPTELVIPGEYSGKTVVVAFKNALTTVTKVTIMNGAILGDGAFEGWTELEEVVLPESVTEIPARAFAGCTSLEDITLPESCTVIKSMAFAQAGLRDIVIKGELAEVQQFAFAECNNLATVTYRTFMIPEVITATGNDKLLSAIWQKPAQD